ncbi:MAG TPA: DUF167 domain-containing protein [Vicinamibacterales bacterium]|nr:DUF167 domain-containing protein [Vicinamibacterales bacterium]
MIHETAAGIEIDVRVIPRAGTSAIAGARDGRLLVRLAAAPVEGAANLALVELLSKLFDRPKRDVRIVRGEKSRAKRVAVAGVSRADARRVLSV